jgi:hypothetical protein
MAWRGCVVNVTEFSRGRPNVPPRTSVYSGRERPVAGLPAGPVAPGAAGSSPARIHRSASSRRFRCRRAVGPSGTSPRCPRSPHSRSRCGSFTDRQGLQALTHHSWHGRELHRVNPPIRRFPARLAVKQWLSGYGARTTGRSNRTTPRAATHSPQPVLPMRPARSNTGKPGRAVAKMSPWFNR